jgi:hypothetical protein
LINRLISMIRKFSRRFSDRTSLPVGLIIIFILLLVLFLFQAACRLVPETSITDAPTTTSATSQSASFTDPATGIPGTTDKTSVSTGSLSDITSSSSSSAITTDSSITMPTITTTLSTTATRKTSTSSATTRPATSTPTTRPTTVRPTSAPAASPTNTPTPGSDGFPYKNYGTFYRDNYGQNSNITTSPDGGISIDTGSTPYGVALLRVDSIPADKRCKAIVTANGKSYQYEIIAREKYLGIPMQLGNGSYTLTVYEQVSGTSFTPKFAHTFDVDLASSLKPFTASSIMSDFSLDSSCVQKGKSLGSGISTTTGRVDAVYRWIVANIDYDRALANSITSGQISVYLPNPERTYTTRKGICFDYASLLCAMLRGQGIPTRLVIGQTPLGYHAWNEVYFAGTGWVIVASFSWEYIEDSGWVMFDTTFAAGGMTPEKIQDTTHTKQKIY